MVLMIDSKVVLTNSKISSKKSKTLSDLSTNPLIDTQNTDPVTTGSQEVVVVDSKNENSVQVSTNMMPADLLVEEPINKEGPKTSAVEALTIEEDSKTSEIDVFTNEEVKNRALIEWRFRFARGFI